MTKLHVAKNVRTDISFITTLRDTDWTDSRAVAMLVFDMQNQIYLVHLNTAVEALD